MLRMLTILACMLAQTAYAQIGVHALRLPALPRLPPPQDLSQTVPSGQDALNPPRLRDLRTLRIGELLRAHGALIERDPRGAPIIRNEVLVFSPSEHTLDAARAAGFVVARSRVLEGLDARIVVLQVPTGTTTAHALKELQELDPQGDRKS